MQPNVAPKYEVKSSSRAQGTQRSQMRAQTRIFAMTVGEAYANLNTMIVIMIIFGIPIRVLFDFGSSRSFISIPFTLDADRELSPLKHKLGVTTHLQE